MSSNLADCGFNELLDLTSYVCRRDHTNCERAIYYTDVLAACEERTGIVQSALDSYSLIMDECPDGRATASVRL